MRGAVTMSSLFVVVLLGCTKEPAPAPPAAAEPKREPLRAEPAPAAPAPPAGPESDPFEALRARQAAHGGPVHWKQLAPVLRARVGPFKAENEVEGVHEALAEDVAVSSAVRHYRAGERLFVITIIDEFVHPVAPLLKGAESAESAPDLGAVERAAVGPYPALFSWHEEARESRAYILVAQHVVDLAVFSARGANDVKQLARLLELDLLTKLRGNDEQSQGEQ